MSNGVASDEVRFGFPLSRGSSDGRGSLTPGDRALDWMKDAVQKHADDRYQARGSELAPDEPAPALTYPRTRWNDFDHLLEGYRRARMNLIFFWLRHQGGRIHARNRNSTREAGRITRFPA